MTRRFRFSKPPENARIDEIATVSHNPDRFVMEKEIKVSVIITTRNEEKNIARCLSSIKEQSYPAHGLETIVVDNASADRTKAVAEGFGARVLDKGPERSAQRNLGVAEAKGGFAIYLDADMAMSPEVIAECVRTMESDPALVALHIPEIVTGDRFFSRVRRFERSFYDGTVIDGARFFRREAFMKVGGFDESLTGPEDWDLDKKLKAIGKVALIKAPIYHNEAEFELGKYLTKKGYYAQKFDDYIAKWGAQDPDIRRQFGLEYRYFGVFLEDGKWKRLLAHPCLAAGMYFLRGLVGVKFLLR